MTRVGLHNTGGGTCHLLLGKVVFSLVFLPRCQLPQHSLMLVVGSLSLQGNLCVLTGDSLFQFWLYLCHVSVNSVNLIFFPQVTTLPFAAAL